MEYGNTAGTPAIRRPIGECVTDIVGRVSESNLLADGILGELRGARPANVVSGDAPVDGLMDRAESIVRGMECLQKRLTEIRSAIAGDSFPKHHSR